MKKHIHMYQRAIIGKDYKVYRCMLPDCTHYIAADLAEKKKSLCHRCGDEFVMTKRSLLLVKPHCIACTKGSEQTHDLTKIVHSVLDKFGVK